MPAPSRSSPVMRPTIQMMPTPAAGEMTRVPFHTPWFMAMANTNSERGTSTGQTTRRAGESNAVAMPVSKLTKTTCQTSTYPVTMRVPSMSMKTPAAPSLIAMIRRGFHRSASAPASRLNTRPGTAWAAATMPSAMGLPVMSYTSQPWAAIIA